MRTLYRHFPCTLLLAQQQHFWHKYPTNKVSDETNDDRKIDIQIYLLFLKRFNAFRLTF